jgi:hypothetical protein
MLFSVSLFDPEIPLSILTMMGIVVLDGLVHKFRIPPHFKWNSLWGCFSLHLGHNIASAFLCFILLMFYL